MLLCLGCFTVSRSKLTTPAVISSCMVIQQGKYTPIWGNALPDERIDVRIGKQHLRTKASSDGTWIVWLKPMKADGKTQYTLTIKGRKEKIEYTNIVVGEVWIAAGQSNMQYSMKRDKTFVPPKKGKDLAVLEMNKPDNLMIRVYVSARNSKKQGTWAVAGRKSLPDASTVGYYFAKALSDSLNVPVGIITAALGGTRIESWTTAEAYGMSEDFAEELKSKGNVDRIKPGTCYNTFIRPIQKYSIRGFLWYQGENNCGIGGMRYARKMKVLADSWRQTFGGGKLPFYYVLLAPHVYSDRLHRNGGPQTAETLPLFREQQKEAARIISDAAYTSVSDLVDDLHDIHPSYKWTVGKRLSNIALEKCYGRKGKVCVSPNVEKVERDGHRLSVTFGNVGDGLTSLDGKRINWFEVAGDDGVFHYAVADITGKDKVGVYSDLVQSPRYVRMGWHETAEPNLGNSEKLPTASFGSIAAE